MEGEALIRICGFGLLAAVCGVILREMGKGALLPLRAALGFLVFSAALVLLFPVVERLASLSLESGVERYGRILLKALGVALISEISASLCRDLGEGTVASGIEFAGKAAILGFCLPLVEEALETAGALIGWTG